MGKWFTKNPGKRENIFLATKFANVTLPDGTRAIDSTPAYCKAACEKSLKRLGLPSVDLYYCHRVDNKTPVEKTMQAMVELKNEGKFKYLGISECSADTLRRAHAVHPISALQIEYSPFALDIENPQIAVLKTARELGISIIAYSPIVSPSDVLCWDQWDTIPVLNVRANAGWDRDVACLGVRSNHGRISLPMILDNMHLASLRKTSPKTSSWYIKSVRWRRRRG